MVFLEIPAMAKKQKNKGITPVESLIVVLLLGGLVAIAGPKIHHGYIEAKAYECCANINILNCAIEKYYLTNGTFPDNLNIISKDNSCFPNGELRCPVTGKRYSSILNIHNMVDAGEHEHPVITK